MCASALKGAQASLAYRTGGRHTVGISKEIRLNDRHKTLILSCIKRALRDQSIGRTPRGSCFSSSSKRRSRRRRRRKETLCSAKCAGPGAALRTLMHEPLARSPGTTFTNPKTAACSQTRVAKECHEERAVRQDSGQTIAVSRDSGQESGARDRNVCCWAAVGAASHSSDGGLCMRK